MAKIKKATIAVVLCVVILAPLPSLAQTQAELEAQYQTLLVTLINLLIEQVKVLQAQLVILQENQEAHGMALERLDIPAGAPDPSEYSLPSIKISANGVRTINPSPSNPKVKNLVPDNGVIGLRFGAGYLQDSLEVEAWITGGIGFFCDKTGNWYGRIGEGTSELHENIAEPKLGSYSISCWTKDRQQSTSTALMVGVEFDYR